MPGLHEPSRQLADHLVRATLELDRAAVELIVVLQLRVDLDRLIRIRLDAEPAQIDYEAIAHPERTELDSDIYALAVDRVVSVAPLSHDLTSRVDKGAVEELLRGPKRH